MEQEDLLKDFNTTKLFTIDLSVAELKALDKYAFKKMCYLEENKLTDTVCYGLFSKLHYSIVNLLKD